MSSVVLLREFIGERLSAAASEIFSEFEKTILRYEEELDRQRRLLDVSWKPELKLHRVDLQQEPVHKTELIFTNQQLYNLERNSSSSLDLEEPELPQIKEEPALCTNQHEDQLHLKQETDPFMVTALFEEREPEPDRERLICESSAGPEDQDSGSKKMIHRNVCHDLQQEPFHKKELILTDQQLCNQERNSSLDQEEPELPQIKEEQEFCTNQEEDQLQLKQEADPFMVIALYEEGTV
ncbi:uncharacterized protein LOC119414321 [Nematolebias whitei]|uniref:uncharacterized protein LOC119414321 n=1 Tax=Nematolebias whitei TaxID=451745 RepID=UPI00189A6086|nr:uncharacterized protein LOC119414321 [Nematolebias whitei]